MNRTKKVTLRNTRQQRHAMAVLGGAVFEWRWKHGMQERGGYSSKQWFLHMPEQFTNYVHGPWETKHAAVEKALSILGVEDAAPPPDAATSPDAATARNVGKSAVLAMTYGGRLRENTVQRLYVDYAKIEARIFQHMAAGLAAHKAKLPPR